eukprot:4729044-Pleurochrysis_carterae.AAC.2
MGTGRAVRAHASKSRDKCARACMCAGGHACMFVGARARERARACRRAHGCMFVCGHACVRV